MLVTAYPLRTANSKALVVHQLVGSITGKESLSHKHIQTSVEIKVLHLQNIDTIFTLIPISSVRK